ncbi:hypothetical protein [Propionimicrobium sp. PCR01-08-3]|uniref:hypothetical protein n=1 Tax=Propionimicrobium sp. PCR01-08-3 TaxID=3052086 RepID=UPI00255CA17C|nr:hypothetical protein [Propionimicrobium sp. PCR01-08-3]WIY82870.1 hypothetical protein QQ658_00465 [Propionimicrobium sp. PCR01-08-3]
MTQASASYLASTEDAPATRPFGFASPVAPPLSGSEPVHDATPGPAAPPQDFAPPDGQARPLDQIAPAPSERRDPHQPLLEAPPDESVNTWDPTQPVPASTTSSALAESWDEDSGGELDSQELSALPPPNGAPAGGTQSWPAPGQPTGQPGFPPAPGMPQPGRAMPAAQYPTGPSPYPANPYAAGPSPYPANPYATGSYSSYYQGGYNGRQQSRPNSQALSWVIGLLITGMLWGWLAPFAIICSGVIAAIKKVPGRILVTICGSLTLVVSLFWYLGYFYEDQLQNIARLLCLICLAGIAIMSRNQRSRRPRY